MDATRADSSFSTDSSSGASSRTRRACVGSPVSQKRTVWDRVSSNRLAKAFEGLQRRGPRLAARHHPRHLQQALRHALEVRRDLEDGGEPAQVAGHRRLGGEEGHAAPFHVHP